MNKLTRRLLAGALDAAADHLAETEGVPSMATVGLALFAAGAAGSLALYAIGELRRLRSEAAAFRASTNAALEKMGSRVSGASTPTASSGPAPASAN